MTQGLLNVPNGNGLAVRSGFNDAVERLATCAAGTARPSDIKTWECWIETDNPGAGIATLWQWDGTSDIFRGLINTTTHTFVTASVTTTKGDLIKRGASADARFAIGGAYQKLGVNAAADDLEWQREGWTRIADDAVAAGASAIDFTSIPSSVKALRFVGAVMPGTNGANLAMLFARSGSWITTSDYSWAGTSGFFDTGTGPGGSPFASSGASGLLMASMSNDADAGGLQFDILIPGLQTTTYPQALCRLGYYRNSGNARYGANIITVVLSDAVGPMDGVRFLTSSGTISGRVTALGLRA